MRRLALSERGRAAVEAGRARRARTLNRELAASLGVERVEAAARTLLDALSARGAMPAVRARRVPIGPRP